MPQHTQQSIAAVSARKFRQSTSNVLKSTGEENCMDERAKCNKGQPSEKVDFHGQRSKTMDELSTRVG